MKPLQALPEPGPGAVREALKGIWEPVAETAPPRWSRAKVVVERGLVTWGDECLPPEILHQRLPQCFPGNIGEAPRPQISPSLLDTPGSAGPHACLRSLNAAKAAVNAASRRAQPDPERNRFRSATPPA
jgi:hypothetical protein